MTRARCAGERRVTATRGACPCLSCQRAGGVVAASSGQLTKAAVPDGSEERMPRLRKLLLAMLVASLVFAALGATALASRGEVTYFEAPALLLNPSTRPKTLATLQRLGVRALRVE